MLMVLVWPGTILEGGLVHRRESHVGSCGVMRGAKLFVEASLLEWCPQG